MPERQLDTQDEIARLLALGIRLQLGSQSNAIVELSKVGFGPTRIAELLGTTSGTVNVAISRAKNSPKKAQ